MKDLLRKGAPFLMLLAAFIAVQIFAGGLWGAAVSVLIVLHCTFYMVNIHRWNKKM